MSRIGSTRYPHVFAPLELGHTRLKNRILMGIVCAGQTPLRKVHDELQSRLAAEF